MLKINNIEVTCIEGIDENDYPDMVDAFASEAYDTKTLRSLSDEELEELNDKYSDRIQEAAREAVYI